LNNRALAHSRLEPFLKAIDKIDKSLGWTPTSASGKRISTFHCLEPNPNNFKRLSEKTLEIKRKWGPKHNFKIFNHQYATGSGNKLVNFDDEKHSASYISGQGNG
jgi:hypothetical protein